MSTEAICAVARALTNAMDKGPRIVPDAMLLADFLQMLSEEGYCVVPINRQEEELTSAEVFSRFAVPPAEMPLPPTASSYVSGTTGETKPSTDNPDEIPF